ncbi:MAG: class I SAM-dependent methyltransferase [Myxococcales bacterium]|nr:class I SAM-dependent methyltransferase [Myxococcales bacterium]
MSGRCPLCDGAMPTRFRVRTFEILRCERCDLERAWPVPSDEELVALYASGYFSGGGHGYEDYFGRERRIADDKARVRMDALERAGLEANSRVLEVGAADGRFLLEAARRGHHVAGVEWSREAREAADERVRGAMHGTIEACAAGGGTYDVFAAFDVIEHWRSPLDELAKVRATLRERALVAIVVPVIDNMNARRWPTSWDQYKPPEHLWFYSRKSLAAMIEATLDAEVLSIECAWERAARWTDATLGRRNVVQRAEAMATRALVRAGVVARASIEDSVLLIARRRGPR